MTDSIRSFSSFCLFFSGSFLILWPYALFLGLCVFGVPLYYYWNADFLQQIQALFNGQFVPSNDFSLIFLIPGFIVFGVPFLLCFQGGETLALKLDLSNLFDMSHTVYGFLGWSIALATFIALLGFSIWSVNKVLNLSLLKSAQYLSVFAIMISLISWTL